MERNISDKEMSVINKYRRIRWTVDNQDELFEYYLRPLKDPKIIEHLTKFKSKFNLYLLNYY